MTDTALILVDIQNDYFDGGDWTLHNMAAAAQNAARLLAAAREKGDFVVHIRHENPSPDAPFFRPGSTGADIHAAVLPRSDEPVLTKGRANSFADTGLLGVLQAVQVEKLVICGAMSQMCIGATVRAAADFGFAVTLAEDACAARAIVFDGVEVAAEQVHASYMASLAMGYGQVVKTTDLLG